MLTDTLNRAIRYLPFDLVSGEQSTAIVIRVTPDAERTLRCGVSADVTFKARENGTADPYVDISTGLDLSGYPAGVPVDFDLICLATTGLTGLRRVPLAVVVTESSAAGWAS